MNKTYARHALRLEPLEPRLLLATFFVDGTNGNDLQSVGSSEQPFLTISRAAIFAQPGDTVAIREGVYREQVSLPRSGTETNPITFEAYNGESVMVTTTDLLSGWTQHDGNIYKASFNSSVRGRNGFTLFADGQLMTEAHWSDLGANVDTLVSSNFASMGSGDKNSFTDSALVGMPDDHWNGAFVWAQTSDFTMEARRIADFQGSTGRITLTSPFGNDPRSGDRYLIYDHINALDAPGEWFFEEQSNTVYFWAPGGGDPDNYQIEAKVRDEGFDLNANSYIHITGIVFRGGDIDITSSDGVLLQGARIVAPNRGFGPEGSGGAQALRITGSNNIIRDNEIEYAWATVAEIDGADNHFINNYVHHAGYNNSNAAVVGLRANAERTLVSHNTIEHIGRAAIGGVGGIQSVIQYNDMSRVAQMTADVGAIYLLNNSLGNSIIHHNVFHDITAKLSNGIYLDNNASDVTVHHNITYNTSAFGGKVNLPNSYVLWFNNTHYGSGRIDAWGPSTSRDSSTGSKFFNNLISSLDSDLTNSSDPAEASNNVFSMSSANFMNAAAGDFRLRATSAAVDAGREIQGITDVYSGIAPDAGALELGQEMWAYGHNFAVLPQPEYEWFAVPFSNRVANPSFDASLAFWTSVAGSPSRYNGNAWNYRADALAIVGTGAVEFKPGDRLEQQITGLLPGTTYQVSAFARLVEDLQLENNDGSFGSFTQGNQREERYISDVDAGEWVKFDDVDFGAGSPRFNRIEIGSSDNSAVNVQLRLDGPTGQLIGTLNVPSRGQPWFMTPTGISSVTGVHDLYVVFQGSGGANGKFDRIRLLNTSEAERVTLGATDYDNQGSSTSAGIGGAYWSSAPQGLTFTTGPTSQSATIFIEKQGGRLNGYVDTVAFTGDAFEAPTPTRLELYIDPATGRTVLSNNTANAISFDGYRVADATASLQPNGWFSLEDQEYEGGIWREAGVAFGSTTPVSEVAELTVSSATTLEVGESVYLGQLFDPSLVSNVSFQYFYSDTLSLKAGVVRFEDPGLPVLSGDYNGDLAVDSVDYAIWRESLGTQTASFAGADGNGDGLVNRSDYLLWKRNYSQIAISSASATLSAPLEIEESSAENAALLFSLAANRADEDQLTSESYAWVIPSSWQSPIVRKYSLAANAHSKISPNSEVISESVATWVAAEQRLLQTIGSELPEEAFVLDSSSTEQPNESDVTDGRLDFDAAFCDWGINNE